MKIYFFGILISTNIVYSEINFNGNIDFSKKENKNLTSSNNIEYKLKLYEKHNYLISLSNSLSVDLDCFNNEIKETNVFTTLRIDF